jgi:formylglycine-generating enzyme required for sulfatase activity
MKRVIDASAGWRWMIMVLSLSCSVGVSAQQAGFDHHSITLPGSTITLSMRAIPGGTFAMGNDEKKNVSVSDFWIGAFEVTHDQFGIFFKDESLTQGSKVDAVTRPTAQYIDLSWNMGKEGGFPVNSMSVDAAMMFCRWLYQKTGVFYRLPTEAEWEYACRAGAKTTYPFGDDEAMLGEYAWHAGNSSEKYQKTGTKKPNAWGLHDMLGNVAEWTLDQYDDNYFSLIGEQPKDPVIPPSTRYPRSVRGGSYLDNPADIRPGMRRHSEPIWNQRDPQVPKSRWWLTDGMFVGFRIVRPRVQPSTAEAEKFYTLYLGR